MLVVKESVCVACRFCFNNTIKEVREALYLYFVNSSAVKITFQASLVELDVRSGDVWQSTAGEALAA